MRMKLLLRKLQMDHKEFVTARELEAYCKSMKLDYDIVLRYFESRRYLLRIFRGIFYVRSPEEFMLGRTRYNHFELVGKGLALKKVSNWYFGLHTALKLNNMTHEHFAIEDVVNDKLSRPNPMTIAGSKFKFIKFSPSLLLFGIKKGENGIRYSDPEKTVLDFIYLWRYNGVPEGKIVADVAEWAEGLSKEKAKSYARKYPDTVAEIVERVIT